MRKINKSQTIARKQARRGKQAIQFIYIDFTTYPDAVQQDTRRPVQTPIESNKG